MNRLKASVVICTYNRADFLTAVLDSLRKQLVRQDEFEVIVVDNNSSDDTSKTVKRYISRSGSDNIRYVFEGKQGLSNARNRGSEEAKGEVVAFLDDDALPLDSWLSSLLGVFGRRRADVVGGRVELVYEAPKPDWVTRDLELYLARLDWGDVEREIHLPHEWLVGANMAFKKMVLTELRFNPDLGRTKNSLVSGEETDICMVIQDRGGMIVFSPDAVVMHYVPSTRLTRSFFRKRAWSAGYSMVVRDRSRRTLGVAPITMALFKKAALACYECAAGWLASGTRFRAELGIWSTLGGFSGLFRRIRCG